MESKRAEGKAAIGTTPATRVRATSTTTILTTATTTSVPGAAVTTTSIDLSPRTVTAAGDGHTHVVSPSVLLRRTQYKVGRTASKSVESRALTFFSMGTKHKNLMEQIVSESNLRLAYRRARSGKRLSTGHLLFKEYAEVNLERIRTVLTVGSYQVSPYFTFRIYEPKEREIMALPFYDRVVQHALVNVVGPIFEKIFLPVSYACRDGMGTHAAVIGAQATMRRLQRDGEVWCLKMDFSKYFASIDRAVLNREIRRKISCRSTLALIESITSPEGKGLPMGNLTSQLWANLYGHIWDRWLVHEKGFKSVFRYMDDTLVFSNDWHALDQLQREAEVFLAERMKLRFSKWSLTPVTEGIPFLGFRIWPEYKLLKHDSVRRARRKITHYRKHGRAEDLRKFVASWQGHAGWADTRNLFNKLGIN